MSELTRVSSDEAKARGYDPVEVARIQKQEAANVEARALIPAIQAAFDGVPRPKITLSVARGLDDEWHLSDERVAELASSDPEQRWQDVPLDAVEGHQENFCFSDADGWRFYLPAYMTHCLQNFPWWDWVEPLGACSNRLYIGLLDEAQLECVERFVELCERHGHYP